MEKEDRELIWLIKLIGCEYKRKKFGSSLGGTKTDFEVVVGICPKNKDFRAFLKDLIERGELEYFGVRKGGGNTFTINKDKMIKRVRAIDYANKFYKFCVDDYLSFKL